MNKWYVIEAHSLKKFLGYVSSNNNMENKTPAVVTDINSNEIRKYYSENIAREAYIDLSTKFLMYDFNIREVITI